MLTPNETATTFYSWDSTSSMTTYTVPINAAPAGAHNFYYYSVDSANNTETINSQNFKVDTVKPIDPTSFNSTDSTGTWLNHNNITLNWSADATDNISGVDGYSIDWDHSSTPTTAPVMNVGYGQITTNSPTLIDGSNWWAHLRTKDKAGNWTSTKNIGPFKIDTTAPNTTFTISPTTPDGENGWYTTTPTIMLTPNETATTFYSWDSTASMSTYSTTLTAPAGAHNFYYYSVDSANNTETVKSQNFKVDTVKPIDPTSVTSLSHTVGNWSNDNTIEINFSGASGTISQLDGYSVSWSQNGTATPDTALDLGGTATSTVSSALGDGIWYFNLRTEDNAGNWTSTVHMGPFKIDTTAPTNPVSAVETAGIQDNTLTNTVSDPDFTWSGATDVGSGISGYNYYFGTNASGTASNWTTSAAFNPSAVSPGTYYLRVRTKDNAGNLSNWTTLFTFKYKAPAFTSASAWSSGVGNWDGANNKLVAGDFNNDGYQDIVSFYNYPATRQVKAWVWLNDGAGNYGAPQVWWDSGPGNWDWAGITLQVGDYNGDGSDDLAAFYGYFSERQARAFVFNSNGDNGFNNPTVWWDSGAGNWDIASTKLVSGDFNNDNKDDLAAFYGYFSERQARAFVFTAGTGNFNAPTAWWDSGAGNWDAAGTKIASGDFNNDGKDDLLAFYGYFTEHQTRAFVFTAATGNFNAPTAWWDSGPGNWDLAGTKLTVGNFDTNAGSDVAALYDYGSNQARIFVFSANSLANQFNAPAVWWNSGPGNWNWSATILLSGNASGLTGPNALDELLGFYDQGGNISGIFGFS